MEKELNIAAILKDKPKGTKLYDKLHNTYVKLDYISNLGVEIVIWAYDLSKKETFEFGYSELGTVRGYLDGLQILKPSKSMQDWSKFAWKKGDVLTNDKEEYPVYLIFESFDNDEYTSFKSRYISILGDINRWLQFDNKTSTNLFRKVSSDAAKSYIEKVEEHYGGKLNLETLEIEKPQFKDGDIVTIHKKDCDITFIFNRMKTEDSFYYYAFHTYNESNTGIIGDGISLPYEWTYIDGKISPATDSEKQQLFDALAKENKAWDADKKAIVDLPKKYKFKTMDYFLARYNYSKDALWNLYQYAFTDKDGYIFVVNESCIESDKYTCIPYNEETKHLLGTTDDWEGGEG